VSVKVVVAAGNGIEADLAGMGLEVIAVESADLTAALGSEPDFVVVDESLDFSTELVVRFKAEVDGPDRDRVPIVTIKAGPRRVRCMPDVTLEGADAAKVSEAGKALVMRRARQRRLFDQEAYLRVPTTPEDVDRVGDLLEMLVSQCGYTEEDQVKLVTTFREAIGNAQEHGNKKDPNRTIEVRYYRSADRLAITISDEGEGFDTSSFLTRATEVSALEHTRSRRETEARPGGLGVFIMKETCDDIRFNEAGNQIYLMKYLPGRGPS
jgi:serine/threonine-protein kinase RsbW